jgi:DeoR/GlpR family transcriptional regulator of sugar metabolism
MRETRTGVLSRSRIPVYPVLDTREGAGIAPLRASWRRSGRCGTVLGRAGRAETPEVPSLRRVSNAVTGSRHRHEDIVGLATTTGLPSVEDLAVEFSVPPSAIRGDLATLQFLGRRTRTFSGATVLRSHRTGSSSERTPTAVDTTHGIARWAAKQIRSGETVLLDAGSAVAALARQLRPARNLTVATTSLDVLQELVEAESIHVECLGGTLRQASRGFVGPLAEAALERMTFDRAFLGADGITAEDGICAVDLQQTRLKELVTRRADQTYVLVHSAALGQRPFHAWAPLPPGWTLVTDQSAEAASLAPFRAHGAEVIVVNAQGITTAEM